MTNPLQPAAFTSYRRAGLILAWVATIVWAIVIYNFSTETFSETVTAWILSQLLQLLHVSVSASTFDLLNHLARKSAHLTEYAIFGLLLYHSFEFTQRHQWRFRIALWSIVTAGLYSLTDEYHQTFTHGRTASLADCALDTLGAAIGILVLYVNDRFFQARINKTVASNESAAETKNGVAGE